MTGPFPVSYNTYIYILFTYYIFYRINFIKWNFKLLFIIHIFNKERTILYLILTKYDYNTTLLVADYTDGLKGVMPKEVEGVYAPYLFEGETVMGVKNYKHYLTQMYGDYMKIPDGEHQRQHNFHILDLNMPYREYKNKTT